MTKEITVAIVEDNYDIRAAFEQILVMSTGYKCIGLCSSGEEAIKKLPEINPDVVLMDIGLGGISGVEAVRELKPIMPDTRFIMCTVYEDEEQIFESLGAGASGYILKKTPSLSLLNAITEAYEGGSPMSNQIARKVVAAFNNTPKESQEELDLDDLTNREREILEYLSRGLLYKEIAETLKIGMSTVRQNVYHVYEKLHVTNRVEAVNRYFGRLTATTKTTVRPVNKTKGSHPSKKKYRFSTEQIKNLYELSISVLSFVNHDLAGQKNAVYMLLLLMKDEIKLFKAGKKVDHLQQLVKKMLNNLQAIGAINDQISSYFNAEASDFDEVFLSRPFELVGAIQEKEKRIKIRIECSYDHVEIVYPHTVLKYIFSELIENARKHGSSNSSVLVKIRMTQNNFECEVHDSGKGFAGLEVKELVPMTSIRQSGPGKKTGGRGLKIIERTILKSKGHLFFANSDILKGGMVYFDFPVIDFSVSNNK